MTSSKSNNQRRASTQKIRFRGRYLESEVDVDQTFYQDSFGGESVFSKVNPFPPEEQLNDGYLNVFDGLGFEDRFPGTSKAPPKNMEKEIFNNMKRQFEFRISNLPLQTPWKESRNTQPQVDLKFFSRMMLLADPNTQIKDQENEIADLRRELAEIRSKKILERKELESEKRKLRAERESIQKNSVQEKRRPRSSEEEMELQRKLDVRWNSTERELQKRFEQMESLKDGLLTMQENLRRDKMELEKKNKEHDNRAKQLDRLINPTQFIQRERKLASQEKDFKRREIAFKKKEDQLLKRKELVESREAEIERRLKDCKAKEERVKGEREKLAKERHAIKSQGNSEGRIGLSGYVPKNLTEERARLFQKETMLLQKKRALTQREQSLQEREKKESKHVPSDAQKIILDNLEADKEEIFAQKHQMALQMDALHAEKKQLQDLRRLTHRAQVAFDRESSNERSRLSLLEEKLKRVQESFGDKIDIVMKIQEQEDDLARRGEELLALYEDIQDQEKNIQIERQKLRQERLKFEHERTRILHKNPNLSGDNIAKMKEMHRELKNQVSAMKELKTQISHLIISEQIDWVRHPELREQVLKLTKVDPLDPPSSPSSSRKSSRASFDRTVKYEKSPRKSPRTRLKQDTTRHRFWETKQLRSDGKSSYDAHGTPFYSFKTTSKRHLFDNPMIGYE